MIARNLEEHLRQAAGTFPVLTVTGPRQSGKTTLCRATFPNRPYISLEDPEARLYATEDPRGFLAAYPDGVIIDEVQRVPDLLSYIQVDVDERPDVGRYVLTGSANVQLLESVSQSLAGRTALLTLLPCSWDEVTRFDQPPTDVWSAIWAGGYPAIYDRSIPPAQWYAAYVATYVERDVRRILNVTDLTTFQTFLRLAAGRTAQLLNLSGLGADSGITHNTARAWLSVLETTYVVWRIPPLHANWVKRQVKTPKLAFLDSGLLCYLLGIRDANQLRFHPLRGPIFESWVVSEVLKVLFHHGERPAVTFYRDRKGHEVDLLVQGSRTLSAVECKAGETVAADFFDGLERLEHIARQTGASGVGQQIVVYAGGGRQQRSSGLVLPWNDVAGHPWWE